MAREIKDLTGKTFGEWTVLRFDSKTKHNDVKWFCRCSCGTEKPVYANVLTTGKSKSCGCKNKIEMIGQRFGRLVVIEKAEPRKRLTRWKCQCDCGNISFADGADLRRSRVISCGCYAKEATSERLTVDIIGQKFGRLTVMERMGSDKNDHALWKCKCNCGNIKIIDGQSLRKGLIQSCRCLAVDLLRERCKTEEFRDKFRGSKNPSFGIVRHSTGCWYDLPSNSTIWIRSTYEKRVLDYLTSHDIKFEYEPTTFNLGNTTYTPDLFLPEYNMFWEVKGYLRNKDKLKLELFKEKFNKININIIQIDDIKQLERNENDLNMNKVGISLNEYLEGLN